jgi:hypothetical protein
LLLRTPDKSEQNEQRPRTIEANKRIVRLLLLSAQYLDDLSTNCPRVLPLKPMLDRKQELIPVLLGLLPAGSKAARPHRGKRNLSTIYPPRHVPVLEPD